MNDVPYLTIAQRYRNLGGAVDVGHPNESENVATTILSDRALHVSGEQLDRYLDRRL